MTSCMVCVCCLFIHARRVLGVTGEASFEEWIENFCNVCVVSTVERQELLTNANFELFRRAGVKVQCLELPDVNTFVSGTKQLVNGEWELDLRDAFAR